MIASERRRAAARAKGVFAILASMLTATLLSACAADLDADSSTEFGPSSEKAIIILGTSANPRQVFTWSGESLSTFWQEYDPTTRRLMKGGSTFQTKVLGGLFSRTDYDQPTVTVLEVDPGYYALIGAGFPHLMTLFVRSIDGRSQTSNSYVVDPRKHIDPQAKVEPRQNFLFSVEPGQIAYIGHFEFVKLTYLDQLGSINYIQDPAAARLALQEYPGISGEMVTLNLTLPTETAAR